MLLFILCLLLFAAVWLFYSLQEYAVTTSDGVRLELPFLDTGTGDESEPSSTTAPRQSYAPVELVIEDPDYSNLHTGAGENLEPLHAVFVAHGSVTAEGLSAAAANAESLGANTLVLDMKPASGLLSWSAASETANSYGTAGTENITETLISLKENYHLVAQLSVCIDDLIAERNPMAALTAADGSAYSDIRGKWLDPYNTFVREYILQLMRELADMGFDEILLNNLMLPVSDSLRAPSSSPASDDLGSLGSEGEGTPAGASNDTDPSLIIASLARRVSTEAKNLGLIISAQLDSSTIQNGQERQTGQDTQLFFAVFDRVFYPTSADRLQSDRLSAGSVIDSSEMDTRFVAVMSSASDTGSWLISG